MEIMIKELEQIELTSELAEARMIGLRKLEDLELALVGGGVGDVQF